MHVQGKQSRIPRGCLCTPLQAHLRACCNSITSGPARARWPARCCAMPVRIFSFCTVSVLELMVQGRSAPADGCGLTMRPGSLGVHSLQLQPLPYLHARALDAGLWL